VIRLEGLTRSFGDLHVLRGFDLEVSTGETVAVIGRSGEGKSVLLKHVAGLMQPDSGEVWIGDEQVTGADRERIRRLRLSMGYVFQSSALFDSMTVAENVRLALRRHGTPAAEIEGRARDSLEIVGLGGWEDRYPAELSGGMRKRAGVARAVAPRPTYLLYDEPTSGLDPVTTSVIDELVLQLKEDLRATSIVVTHDMRSACRVADRIALLREGRVSWLGTPEEIERTDDAAVKAFVEGRRDLWPGE
jgi:phospholipid/cholesterol/gamma-HCH transport system ATP-binding protein